MHYYDKDHETKSRYTEDRIKWKDADFKLARVVLKEDIYNPYQMIQVDYKPHYQEEEYYTREYGDIGFYKWLKEQNHHCVAILAEIVSAPKINPIIDSLRPKVKDMKIMTIEEYRKKKCIGATKVEWIKKLKKKYGINILRFLYASN